MCGLEGSEGRVVDAANAGHLDVRLGVERGRRRKDTDPERGTNRERRGPAQNGTSVRSSTTRLAL